MTHHNECKKCLNQLIFLTFPDAFAIYYHSYTLEMTPPLLHFMGLLAILLTNLKKQFMGTKFSKDESHEHSFHFQGVIKKKEYEK